MADTPTTLSGTWSATVTADGQTEYVSGSTVVSGAVALANGVTLTVGSGAVVSGLSTSASTVIVKSGGTLKDTSLVNGTLYASSGAISDENSLNSVAAYFSSGSVSENDSFYTTSGNSVKYVYVYSGGALYSPVISSGGFVYLSSGGFISGGSLSTSGVLSASAGSVVTNFGEIAGGSATFSGSYGNNLSAPVTYGQILTGSWTAAESSAGIVTYISGTTTVSGAVSLAGGATLNIQAGTVVSGLGTVSGGIATVNVASGATLLDSYIQNGYVNVASGGTTSGNKIDSTVLTLSAGASSVEDIIYYDKGYGADMTYVSSGAFLINPVLSSGGTASVLAGGVVSGGKIYASGGLISATGASVSGLNYVADGFTNSANYNAASVVPTSALEFSYSSTSLTGTWSAVLNNDNQTVYQSGSTIVSGAVSLAAGATLNIQSGAVVSGLYASGGAGVIHIASGGELISSYLGYTNIYVSSGGTTSANQYNADAIYISAGGSSLGDTYYAKDAYSQNAAYVSSGGYVSGADVLPGGNIIVYNGGTYAGGYVVTGTIVAPERTILGGVVTSNTGATVSDVTVVGEDVTNMLSGNTIGSGASPVLTFSYSATSLAGTWSAVLNSDKQTVYQSNTTVVSGPVYLTAGLTLHIESGAVVSGVNTQSGGIDNIYVSSGGTLADSYIQNGYVYISSGGVTSANQFNSDPVSVSSGATSVDDIYYNSAYGIDPVTVSSGGTLTNAYVLSGGSVAALSGSVVQDIVSYGGSVSSVDGTITNDSGNPCFLAGANFQTPEGDVVVENLREGDVVATYNPDNGAFEYSKVTWVGKGRRHASVHLEDDLSGYPVRILRDALADGVPSADLLITSEHSLFFNGGFVPVRMLVNGYSVFYDKNISEYEYYHVETEKHSVLIASNVLSESYLDTGNRKGFVQTGQVVRLGAVKHDWETDAVAPLTVSRDVVEPVYRSIEERAVQLGLVKHREEPEHVVDHGLYLLTQNGGVIRQVRNIDGKALFMLPAGVESVVLMSRASRPCDVIGPFVDDRRQLGVLVGEIVLTEGNDLRHITTHAEKFDMSGWHGLEGGPARWTNGAASLPLSRRAPSDIASLSVQICQAGPYLAENKKRKAIQVA
ncbi:Hint domain-containing protein [Acetobacter thailandicus]|uniref:Hint domain-containing protein n=1 Tax=Acetobacter thailandicus TaxID=1502842 RepID=UPI001BAD7279|nr:Hint domain-containing protein [Acetobacter thailandicus]MBS0959481.1 Hint domain-containing protein [Acetobacter thailandicus]